MRLSVLVVAAAAFTAAPSALAQVSVENIAGAWQCQQAARAFNNDPTQSHSWNFALQLDAGGQFQAQGSYYSPSIGMQEQFYGQGTWKIDQANGTTFVTMTGNWTRVGYETSTLQYPMSLQLADTRNMYASTRDQFTEMSSQCQR